MTLRQFAVLNRRGIPARALTFAVVLNLAVLFLLKNTLAIIATGNLGYILAHVFALSAFLLLRRQRPDLPRPIRLPNLFVPLAAALAVFMAVTLVVGATGFSTTGYGGTKELFLALAVLATSTLMWLYRKHVQDRAVNDRADAVPTETRSS
jgi:amino acid transporter